MIEDKITIIICTHNGSERIEHIVKNIFKMRHVSKYVPEIIIVDNHSDDNTRQVIKECSIKYDLIPIRYEYEEALGLSNARKRGVLACTTKWIAFLDDDNFVDTEWIEHIAGYIKNNKNVGALNGAVVPLIQFNITNDEKLRLEASLKVLACTHYNTDEIKYKPTTPFRNPIGAGLVILCNPLKELAEHGWLKSIGRTGDNLSSGEDGELAYWIKFKGYAFGFCPNAILYHAIPKTRLQDAYLTRIWFEVGRGVCIVLKNQSLSLVKNFFYKILIQLRLVKYKKMENKYYSIYYEKYIEGYTYEWKSK